MSKSAGQVAGQALRQAQCKQAQDDKVIFWMMAISAGVRLGTADSVQKRVKNLELKVQNQSVKFKS
jgi:hypothetical protein